MARLKEARDARNFGVDICACDHDLWSWLMMGKEEGWSSRLLCCGLGLFDDSSAVSASNNPTASNIVSD